MKEKTECKLCGTTEAKVWIGCSKGSICEICSENISNAENQPGRELDTVLWILAETYFRKGKGEDVTFEDVWGKEQHGNRMLKYFELWNNKKVVEIARKSEDEKKRGVK